MTVHVESEIPDGLAELWLQSEEQLSAFLAQFQTCRIERQDWTHRAHIGIAACLILMHGKQEALHVMRKTIPLLNESQGGINSSQTGYHETLTVFWIEQIARVISRLPASLGRLDRVRVVVEAYGELRRLDRAVYSFDVLESETARARWQRPDLAIGSWPESQAGSPDG